MLTLMKIKSYVVDYIKKILFSFVVLGPRIILTHFTQNKTNYRLLPSFAVSVLNLWKEAKKDSRYRRAAIEIWS